jgi:hypothetical protein
MENANAAAHNDVDALSETTDKNALVLFFKQNFI